ncbi:MAG: hypothetical protein WD267_04560 [Balneolales bacterium]
MFGTAEAQMFSVQAEESGRMDIPANNVILGYEPTTFTFRHSDNDAYSDYSFTDPVYRVRLELEGFQAYAGVGYNLGINGDINYLNAGAKLEGEFRFAGNQSYFLGIPLILSTDYLQIGSRDETARASEFRQSAAMVGIGLSFGARYNRYRVESRIVPMYGFSVTSFGATGGSRSSITTQNRLYIDRLFNQIGITAGYDYRTSRYSLDDDRFDYDLTSHSIVLGLTF